jgi:hypothetical protein
MLTRRMQVQALAERLAGLKTSFKREDFSGLVRSCWIILEKFPGEQGVDGVAALINSSPEGQELLRQLQQVKPGAKIVDLPSLEELGKNLPPVDWVL